MVPHTQHQLELLTESLRLPAPALARVTVNGLDIDPTTSEADLMAIGGRLFAIRSWTKWALGSVFAAMMRARPHPDQRNHSGEFETGWVSDFATAHHLDPKERREMLGVVMFYRGASPTPGLSFEHHREAMWGAAEAVTGGASPTGDDVATGDGGRSNRGAVSPPSPLATACAYLANAEANQLTVTKLRAEIRSTQRTTPVEQRDLAFAPYAVVFDFRRFAAREMQTIDKLTPDRARLIITDLGSETLAYLDALRSVAAQ